MSESLLLRELQQAASLASKSSSLQEGLQHLSGVFTVFSEEASRLKNVNAKLQERLQTVNQELQIRAHFLNEVLKYISEAILFLDLHGTILLANGAIETLIPIRFEEILHKRFWDIFHDDHFGFSMRESLKFGISHRLIHKAHQQKALEISTSFIFEGPQSSHGLILMIRDASEKQRLHMAVNRSDRMKELGEMAATAAHEIRNSLGGIRGFASLLLRDLAKECHLQEMAQSIIDGTKALEKLVAAMLQYARPIQLQFHSTGLGDFLKRIVKCIKIDPTWPQKISFLMHIPNHPISIPIDPEALRSALLNLILNASQAMPQGGTIHIALLKLEGWCQISIADTGIGMDEDMLKALFSPCFTTKKKGNGLGLVEAKKIVQAHQGTIEVRSSLGKGSTFTISLPLKR